MLLLSKKKKTFTLDNELNVYIYICLGYKLQSSEETDTGLKVQSAQLQLARPACNVFSHDVGALTIEVTYETTSQYVLSPFPSLHRTCMN